MPMWTNTWNSWAWQMAIWMFGVTLLWITFLVVVAWLSARWETRALRRVNASALQLGRARDAQDVQDATGMSDVGSAVGAIPAIEP